MRPPQEQYLSGLLRKSTISSCFPSLALVDSGQVPQRDCLLLRRPSTSPGARAPRRTSTPPGPPLAAARSAGEHHEQEDSAAAVGPKPKNRTGQERRAVVGRLGVDRHLLALEQARKLGVVGKRRNLRWRSVVVDCAFLSLAGYLTGALNFPGSHRGRGRSPLTFAAFDLAQERRAVRDSAAGRWA